MRAATIGFHILAAALLAGIAAMTVGLMPIESAYAAAGGTEAAGAGACLCLMEIL